MGGDDLGSDDEYLVVNVEGEDVDQEDSDSEDSTPPKKIEKGAPITSTKRSSTTEGDGDDEVVSRKKRKKDDELNNIRQGILTVNCETQARLLSQFLDDDDNKFRPNHVSVVPAKSKAVNLKERIQSIVSKKRLKKWNQRKSPCVLIVSLSARRAVDVLKQLAPLNVRAVKLFAKHLTVEKQASQLEEDSFALAVGTPHRILTLAQQGSLSLEHTQLIVLDTFLNQKSYAVYTLPDTVPHTQELLKDFVLPQCKKRRDVNVAFL